MIGGEGGPALIFFPKWFGLGTEGEEGAAVETTDAGTAQADAEVKPDTGATVTPPAADAGMEEPAPDAGSTRPSKGVSRPSSLGFSGS